MQFLKLLESTFYRLLLYLLFRLLLYGHSWNDILIPKNSIKVAKVDNEKKVMAVYMSFMWYPSLYFIQIVNHVLWEFSNITLTGTREYIQLIVVAS